MSSVGAAFFAAVNFIHGFLFGGPIDGTAWEVKVKVARRARQRIVFMGSGLIDR